MGTDLTNIDRAAASTGTAIRSSTASPTATIPRWVDLPELDRSLAHGYQLPIPAGAAGDLRDAALAHAAALAPSTPQDRSRVLLGLRSATITRDESGAEAEASFKMLRVHLEDVPLDILEEACRAYCNAPGRRFFPRSAGELRAFINPLLYDRTARARRLMKLAEQVERDEARAAELAADPADPAAVAEILARYRVGSHAFEQPAAESHRPTRVVGERDPARPCREPTREDYLRMGVAPEVVDAAIANAATERAAAAEQAQAAADFATIIAEADAAALRRAA